MQFSPRYIKKCLKILLKIYKNILKNLIMSKENEIRFGYVTR